MTGKVIQVPNAPKLPFSPAVKAGEYVFLSGQGGFVDEQGSEVQGIQAQTRQCMENIKKVLSAAGSSLDDVVKLTIFLRRKEDYIVVNEIYATYFPQEYPARSAAVTDLVIPNMLIEIECIAYCPKNQK
jgi:2-iminobutanoate/2-iminopropanoate deaminase